MHQFQMCIGFVILLLGIVHSLPGDINVASQLVSREGDQRKIETRSGNVCKDSGRSRISCKFLGKKEESIRKEKCVRNTKCMKTCQKCGYHCTSGIYTATNVSATIETQNGKKCMYEIRPQSPDDLVKVSFENFNLTGNGSPCENYVEVIKDDCSKEKLCGENGTCWTYTTLTGGTQLIFTYFTNDATMPFMMDQKPYFKMKYESKEWLGCQSWEKELSSGKTEFIESHQGHNGQSVYKPHENCLWNIKAGENQVAEIEFKAFKLEGTEGSCGGDLVKIWSGDNDFANTSTPPDLEFCGSPQDLPAVTGKGRYMTVVFETDGSKTNKGFTAEVVQRVAPAACPTLKDGAVDWNSDPGFGITCQWSIEDSVDLTFGNVSVRDDDTLSIYSQQNMSLIREIRGTQLNKIGQNVTIGVTSWLVKFTSAPNSLTQNSFKFSFQVVYNCRNFEVTQVDSKASQKRGRSYCKDKGSEWDLVIDDKECKHQKLRELVDTICPTGLCAYWIGLKREDDWYWVNGNLLQGKEKNWIPGEPNNYGGNEFCVVVHRKYNAFQWADVKCERTFKSFCSRLV